MSVMLRGVPFEEVGTGLLLLELARLMTRFHVDRNETS
jgi:hypothetical protein